MSNFSWLLIQNNEWLQLEHACFGVLWLTEGEIKEESNFGNICKRERIAHSSSISVLLDRKCFWNVDFKFRRISVYTKVYDPLPINVNARL